MTLTRLSQHALISGLIAIIFSANHAYSEVELLDRIVAIVDQKTVTQSELDGRLAEVSSRMKAAGVSLPEKRVLNNQVLEQLISETLQLNMAERYNVTTSDENVIKYIRQIMKQRRVNENQMLQELQAEGITLNEFKENVRKQLTLQTIAQGVVSSRIKISEKDIDNFLNSSDAKFWISPEYHLQHILIAISSSSDSSDIERAQTEAEAVHKQLLNGANFTELAIAKSKGPAALKGGDLGWRKSSALPTLFAEIAPQLEVGGISKPTRSQAGFHILKLLETRGETKQIVTQSKVRHILIEPSEILSEQEAQEKINDIREEIIAGEDFARLARRHSEDIGTKMSGGDLGWSTPGSFVPEFETVMNTIDIGEISEPFLSQFGWHILQVQERREEDLSDDVIRNRARNLLVGRRFEDEVQVWLQEMRDEAFIEIKI